MSHPKNILLVRTDRIGDVILTLPAAAVLKKHFPGCKVTFLVREYTKELAANNPYVDDILLLNEKNGKPEFFSNYKKIADKKFDTVITVFPRFRIALLLFYAGVSCRIGTGYRWYSFLFNKRIYEHRKNGHKHELIHNINLLKAIGVDESITEENCVYGLSPSGVNKDTIEKVFASFNIDPNRKTIIVHPGSGGSAVDLPVEKMKALAELCAGIQNVNVIITGDKKEESICTSFKTGENVFNLCGMFNLGELVALINRADLLIANSTGPIHIAAALGKHVIGFFPKIKAQSPARWAPFTAKKKIFVPPINCTNCSRKQCGELDCMNHISIDEVFESVKEIII